MYDLVPSVETCTKMRKLGFPQDTSFFMWERDPKAPEDDPLNYELVTKLTYYNYEFVAAPTMQEILKHLPKFKVRNAGLKDITKFLISGPGLKEVTNTPADVLGDIWAYSTKIEILPYKQRKQNSLIEDIKKSKQEVQDLPPHERNSMKLGEI